MTAALIISSGVTILVDVAGVGAGAATEPDDVMRGAGEGMYIGLTRDALGIINPVEPIPRCCSCSCCCICEGEAVRKGCKVGIGDCIKPIEGLGGEKQLGVPPVEIIGSDVRPIICCCSCCCCCKMTGTGTG